jgi:hypothetical protein
MAYVEHRQASDGVARHGMDRQRGHEAQPAGAVAAFSVEERGPHDDGAIEPAHRTLAGALRTDESAARAGMQTQSRHVEQSPDARVRACAREGLRRENVHAGVGFVATLAKDSHAVHDDVDVAKERAPVPCAGQVLEARRNPARHAGDRIRAIGITRSRNDIVTAPSQRSHHVSTDEPASAEHQHPHDFPVISVLTEIYARSTLASTTRVGPPPRPCHGTGHPTPLAAATAHAAPGVALG